MAKVAFLGIGLLGSAMVEGMLRRGDAVTVWNRTVARARALETHGATVARADFAASFELTMARKDLRLMIETAGHQPLTVLPGLATTMDEAIAKGHGRDDLGVIAAEVVR